MSNRRELLNSFETHFSFLFQAIKMNRGIPFTNIQQVPFPQDEFLRHTLQMQLWDTALEEESYECYHALSLFTDTEILPNALELAIFYHQLHAVIPLLACLERNHVFMQLGSIQCTQKQCKSCLYIREQLLRYFQFKDDWTMVRKKLAEARKKNLWIMWKPQLLLHPSTDVITRKIFERTKKGWSTVLVASIATIMWRKWIERRLEPSSSYVNNVLAKRFSKLIQQKI